MKWLPHLEAQVELLQDKNHKGAEGGGFGSLESRYILRRGGHAAGQSHTAAAGSRAHRRVSSPRVVFLPWVSC